MPCSLLLVNPLSYQTESKTGFCRAMQTIQHSLKKRNQNWLYFAALGTIKCSNDDFAIRLTVRSEFSFRENWI
ncbi:MAG: hypothetical protein LBT46_01830 [Planctomycetaceae bacterium]|jgi:hypothetical protein|nr:hypothetical protein [Planctomycetaceae bacterium]